MIKSLIRIAMFTMGIGIVLTCCLANIKTAIVMRHGTALEDNFIKTDDGNYWLCEHDFEPGTRLVVTFDPHSDRWVSDDEIIDIKVE